MRQVARAVEKMLLVIPFAIAFIILAPLLFFYLIAFDITPPFGILFSVGCRSETIERVSGVAGLDFEIVYTNCDLLAKDEAITVYASRGQGLPGWFSKREIFKYTGGPDISLALTASDRNSVRVSVEAVSSIHFARDRWEDVTIIYNIGHIEYPSANDPKPRH